MMNDLWRRQVQSMLDALKNGGLPLPNSVLIEMVGSDLYDQFWQNQFAAEDEDQARYETAKEAGVPQAVKAYLGNRAWAQKALADRRKLERRHAKAIARKQSLIDDLVQSSRNTYSTLSDEDKAYLWPLNRGVSVEPAEDLPGRLPGHLIGDPYRPTPAVRAQIAILEAALAADTAKP